MIYWLIAFVVFLIAEVVTLQFVSLWFAIGALGGLAMNMLNMSITVQIVVFLVISVILLAILKPVCARFMKKHVTPTNCDELIGELAKVTKRIYNPDGFGTVVIRGEEWSAVSDQEYVAIEVGAMVEILEIQGVKLIVREKKEWKQ